jgi:valyl-tRNA synthetase
LVKSWEEKTDDQLSQPESARIAAEWMQSKFNVALAELNDDYDKFRISEALMTTYKLVWDDFCAWFLEMVKPPFGQGIDKKTYSDTVGIFENLLKVLHPFMPFLSEEIWHYLREREAGKGSICIATWPAITTQNDELLKSFDYFAEVILGVRNIRKDNNIPNKEKLDLKVKSASGKPSVFDASVAHLCNLTSVEYVAEKPANTFSFVVKSDEFFIPFTANVDVEAEKKKINEELTYTRGFLKSVEAKLSNERFANNAPAQVLDSERKKQQDALNKISMLEDKLSSMN